MTLLDQLSDRGSAKVPIGQTIERYPLHCQSLTFVIFLYHVYVPLQYELLEISGLSDCFGATSSGETRMIHKGDVHIINH